MSVYCAMTISSDNADMIQAKNTGGGMQRIYTKNMFSVTILVVVLYLLFWDICLYNMR